MKKVLIILVILTAPFIATAQDNTTSTNATEVVAVASTTKDSITTEASKEQTAEAKFRAQVNDMNYKKSNEIISIKAYRKSLQIKVKEVKLC